MLVLGLVAKFRISDAVDPEKCPLSVSLCRNYNRDLREYFPVKVLPVLSRHVAWASDSKSLLGGSWVVIRV